MVPFGRPEYWKGDSLRSKKETKAWRAARYLAEHPDGNGVLLPRMHEDIRKDTQTWDKLLRDYDRVHVTGKAGWKDSVAHGISEYWLKTMFAAAGLPLDKAHRYGGWTHSPGEEKVSRLPYSMSLEKHFFESNNVSRNMRVIRGILEKYVPINLAEKIAAAWPDMVRGALAMANISERALEKGFGTKFHKQYPVEKDKIYEIDALIDLLDSKIPPPHRIVAQLSKPEELEALYRVHRRFLDLFPELFEQKRSPFEDYIDEQRKKELEKVMEIENKLARDVIHERLYIEDILPERKYKRLIQLKPEHYKYEV